MYLPLFKIVHKAVGRQRKDGRVYKAYKEKIKKVSLMHKKGVDGGGNSKLRAQCIK